MGQADYIIQQRVRSRHVPSLMSADFWTHHHFYLNVGSKLKRKHLIGNLRAEASVSIFPNAGPGHHLSSQQRHYHHNLSERGAKTLINVVIINNIHLSHLPLNCIKYVRERSRTSMSVSQMKLKCF